MTSIPRLWLPILAAAGTALLPSSGVSQNADASAPAAAQVVPYAMSWEEPAQVRAEGYDYDHEVLVALPPSYHTSPERSYPVLWSMDGAMAFAMTAGIVNLYTLGARIPEIIVVGVGHPSEEGMTGLGKRTFDLFPPGTVVADEGVAAEYMREEFGLDFAAMEPLLKGDRFLDFLVERLRPLLGEQYRMADDHTLWGHSAGGAFAGYALLARRGAFDRFIIGSGTNGLTIELEAAYAAEHDDLDAKVFFGMGDGEINNPGLSAQRLVSRTSLLAENLRLRGYPSLDVRTRLYTDRDHITVMPLIIADGLQHVYADLIADLPKLPW
ncbi:MAG: alpha/beta hydrolase-fold protein [Gemmatimonadetes bacterium]|nr:alpha/beta hydrolase-fold protein [Gemmatimonadota bacterium]